MRKTLIAALCIASPAVAQDPDAGEEFYRGYCAVCHGIEARGDGVMSEVLEIQPTDLTQLSASNGGRFPVYRVVRRIDGRDLLIAHGGEMPLFGHLFDMPDAAIPSESGQPILTAQPIADIFTWLEEIQE